MIEAKQQLGSFSVEHGGMLSLLQDSGRVGHGHIGLTSGGPADREAFDWSNRLLANPQGATTIEVSIGGLKLIANVQTSICVTGADVPLTINGQSKELWCTHPVRVGDSIELGFARSGIRSYLGVKAGFEQEAEFGSVSTVIREGVGGINGRGLNQGDKLWLLPHQCSEQRYITPEYIPNYSKQLTVRVLPGYQQGWFSRLQQRRFYANEYTVSKQWDRMGYRLQGVAIEADRTQMLSEGIAYGAIQIPSDGQPIVLLNDRQTIGGYPKIGAGLSLDLNRLAQCGQGAKVHFSPITMDCAHNLLHMARFQSQQVPILARKIRI